MNRRIVLVVMLALAAGCGKKQGGPGGPGGFAVPVKAAVAATQPLEEKISLVATLAADESVEIKSNIEGTIDRINFEEGETVEKGRLLFTLDEGKLTAAVNQAEADFSLAETNLKRSESMLQNKTISQQEYDQASANYNAMRAALDLTKQRSADARIVAMFDGTMGSRMVSPGQVVGRDRILSNLVKTDPMKVEFRVPERFLGQLGKGQTIEFRAVAYPTNVFKGEVYFIDPQVDTETRTVLVKAMAANADGRLRPGMFGNLDLILRVRENAVVIPETALMINSLNTTVYVVDDKGMAQMKVVVPGMRMAGKVEIVTGLAGGEQVITEGIQKIRPGAPVMVVPPESAAAAPAKPAEAK